uniref:Uncharacterized protein n=1 Tax=Physcomitrium patens TaxID=3218 RepID=A0A2K1IF78_PHYPA|nr:hypothetical protein PHYPA_028517 [Physcomitrium patens]
MEGGGDGVQSAVDSGSASIGSVGAGVMRVAGVAGGRWSGGGRDGRGAGVGGGIDMVGSGGVFGDEGRRGEGSGCTEGWSEAGGDVDVGVRSSGGMWIGAGMWGEGVDEVYSGVGMEGGAIDMMAEECGMWCISEGCWMVHDMSDLFGWGWRMGIWVGV